ncbi:MAG TPA: hypothetical protein ENN19_11555, partial [Chloroflexi bacterium]|nr:hypothetical protein [Chloroflexota bacterium]
ETTSSETTSSETTSSETTFPILFDVGNDHPIQLPDGRLYQADQAWTPETPMGYIGGYRVWSSEIHPVDGTPDGVLHQNQRHEWEAYRFSDIPDGDYLVTLSFSEIGLPEYSIFDVSIEDRVVLSHFRIADEVGGNYGLTRRFTATVRNGELNVVATPVEGKSKLAAIEVAPRSPDDVAPPAPVDVETMSSYQAVLLNWPAVAADDLDGYHVYRAPVPDGPYTRLTGEPVYVSRYQDHVPVIHERYYYRVSAVDVYGNESERSSSQPGVALGVQDASLPLYVLDVSAENLERLERDPFSYDEVPGTFIYQGRRFPVEVRYRGGYGRFVHKKPWKIKFVEDSPFPGEDEINLRADYADRSLMHSMLAYTLFEGVGVPSLRSQHVLLLLNGVYQGVFTAFEQPDENFLRRAGYNPRTSIYKIVHTDTNDWSAVQPSEQAYREAYEKKTNRGMDRDDVIALIELIDGAPEETFASELQRVFDVATYLDYYAVIVLTGNRDFVHHNVYLLHDLEAEWWWLVPYDFDAAFEPTWDAPGIPYEMPIDIGTVSSPVEPWGFSSRLLTRVLDTPQFRAYYCRRLAEFMDTIFSDAAMERLIDTTYAAIEQDGLRDWHKRYREDNSWFVASPDEIKTYVSARKAHLWDEMASYCPAERSYLVINEVMIGDPTTAASAWIEIYNAGLAPVDLSGMRLAYDAPLLTVEPVRREIPDGVQIAAGGFFTQNLDLFDDREPTRGRVMLFQGDELIDTVEANDLSDVVSWGRYPDGADRWRPFSVPTPGATNALNPPVISETRHIPLIPEASETVTIVSRISDDGAALTATLHYDAADDESITQPMRHLWEDLYVAHIPPQPGEREVHYRVVAEDDDGQVSEASRSYVVGYEAPELFINEFLASNRTVLKVPDDDASLTGNYPDWIEIYNPGPEDVDLGGRYLTDRLDNPTRFRIPQGVAVPARGFLVFYADGNPERGPLHTNFRLDRTGEAVGLFDVDVVGNRPIDVYTFGAQQADVSEGRCPDGGAWGNFFANPTPGAANQPCASRAVIETVERTPRYPMETDQVAISAVISHTGDVTATLWYSTSADHRRPGEFVSLPMHPYKEGGGASWRALIPDQPEDTKVAYYVAVACGDEKQEESRAGETRNPLRAPDDVYAYRVGYTPPPIVINEFMADNETTLENPNASGEFPDWIELYNAGFEPVDLGGMYLTDDLNRPEKFRITAGVWIAPRDVLLFYADGNPHRGLLHVNFRLNRGGEEIGLFDSDENGRVLIDARVFGPQAPDVAERRYPDGGEFWISSQTPTPGQVDFPLGRYPYLPLLFRPDISE